MKAPDWRKADDYAFITPKTIGYQGVAWEFLRRNKVYRQDFVDLKNDTVTDAAGNPPIEISDSIFLFHPKRGFYDPPIREGESESEWMARCVDNKMWPRILSPERYVATKWSLVGRVLDPDETALDVGPKLSFKLSPVPRIIQIWEEVFDLVVRDEAVSQETGNAPVVLDEENILVVFDLGEKISPQWNRIRNRLLELQHAYAKKYPVPAPGSTKSDVWIPALRAWDACHQEPDLLKSEMAAVLYGESKAQITKKLSDHLESAAGLIEGRYRDIVRQGQQKASSK